MQPRIWHVAITLGLALTLAIPTATAEHKVGVEDRSSIDEAKTCANEDPDWAELKLEGAELQDGTYSDGTLTVTIEFTAFTDAEPKVFDWESSTVRVIAIFLKGGQESRYYGYDHPGEISDTGLTTPLENGNAISHISFCYELEPVPVPELSTLVLAGAGIALLAGVALVARKRA